MNKKLIIRLLGILSLLLGLFMLLSLPWANPDFGSHTDPSIGADRFEQEGFLGLIYSSLICLAVGSLFLVIGREASGKLFRKEAMAIVGLSWLLATFLGALPFIFSGTQRGPSVRVFADSDLVMVTAPRLKIWQTWLPLEDVDADERNILRALCGAGAQGETPSQLQ